MIPPPEAAPTLRYAIGTFDEAGPLGAAVRDLHEAGFDDAALGLLVERGVVEAKLGDADGAGLAAAPVDRLTDIGVTGRHGPLLASEGRLAEALAGRRRKRAASVCKALRGWLPARHADQLSEWIESGALLLLVELEADSSEQRACRALLRHSQHCVHVHDLSAEGAARRRSQ